MKYLCEIVPSVLLAGTIFVRFGTPGENLDRVNSDWHPVQPMYWVTPTFDSVEEIPT